MKQSILLTILCLMTFILCAQTPYFCSEVGKKSLLASYDNKGQLAMYTQREVMSCTQNGDVTTVVVHNVTLAPDKTQFPYILPYDATYEIKNGDVYLVIAADDKETENSGSIGIFANMKVGDDYGPGEFEILTSGIANKATLIYRKVTGEETITTPAGTFDCIIFEQQSEVRVLGIKQKGITKTWYAKNVGDVKSEVYSLKGELRSRVVLEEFN